jgi:predicted transcriptional regulator
MSTQVRITLHDEVYRRAKQLARLSNRKIEDLLAQAIELSLSPVSVQSDDYEPVSKLSDGEILELSEMQMDTKQDKRFSRLLDRQQARKLTTGEEAELLALMQNYQEKLLRKAQALREAVRRGLRDPLTP